MGGVRRVERRVVPSVENILSARHHILSYEMNKALSRGVHKLPYLWNYIYGLQ
jgi:hypothetical protein